MAGEIDEPIVAPERMMGLWMCLALVVGNMIGSGIFLLPASLAPYGLNAMIGWGITIGGAMCLAFVFAALARAMPHAAGPYDYVRTGFGAPAGFFVMWSYWISTWVTNATIAVAAVSYLSSLAPDAFARPGVAPLTAIGFVLLFSTIACRGARVSGGVQIVTSVLKLLPLIAAIVIAIMVVGGGGETATFAPTLVSGSGIAGAAALTLWAMLGFESATVPDGKVRDPERNLPRATLIGTLVAGLIYLAASSAVFLLLPPEVAAGSSAPFADLVGAYWGAGAASLVAVFAAISCLGALNGWVMLQAEVPFSLARRGVFPSWFARVNKRGVPVNAQLMGSALTTALIAANYTRGLTELFAFMALLATAATLVLYLMASLVALRLIARGLLRGVLLAALASVGAVYSLWTLYGAGKEAVGWGAVLLATGVPVYLLMRRANRSSPAAAAHRATSPESAA
jgi:APA family basic amino acid/polyamine antiporter